MQHTAMTLAEFEAGLDRHGANLARWPADAALRTRQLLDTSASARDLLDEAHAMEALLGDALPAATLTTGALRSRILDRVAHDAVQTQPFAWWLRGSRLLRQAAVAAALLPLLLGYAIGAGYQPGDVNEELASDVSLLAFADYEGYADAN